MSDESSAQRRQRGLRSAEAQRLWAEIQENSRLLASCARHLFKQAPARMVGMRLQCEHCSGKMHALDVLHYLNGYKAAGKDPKDVAPWWDGK